MPTGKTNRVVARRTAIVPAARSEFRVAAIDVGSNSLHMVIAQADTDGAITTLWRMKEMVGLGRISFPSRRLSAEAMDRAMATLRRFQEAAKLRRCEKILAVATSAVREAINGGDFLTRVQQELGLNLRVVSARDEAKLIYLGVRHAVELGDGPTFILDIGGGSTEFIVADKNRAALLESRKLGAARMTAKYIKSDPVSPADLKSLMAQYDRELTPLCEQILALKPAVAMGTSGTLENLATMCQNLSGNHSNTNGGGRHGDDAIAGVIEREPLAKLVGKLIESRSQDRSAYKGLDDQRKDQIVAGAVLVNELFRRLNLEKITVCKSALREGMMVDYLSRHLPELSIRREVPDPRRRSVLDLARRCDWHQTHAEQVARLCLELFDQLKPLHGQGRRARELIEYAALLHDIGWHIGKSNHNKHSKYLILHGDLKGFTDDEIRIMAGIARYHRKSPPKPTHKSFAALGKRGKRIVQVGAAMLRIADGLDRSHSSVVSAISCTIHRKRVDVRLKTRGDAELEIWGGQQKMAYFAELFGREVEFHESA
jgi:exopolyphosphatase/guanosine-5'-triphosphate,3'-diphosphate pyrophosphatase